MKQKKRKNRKNKMSKIYNIKERERVSGKQSPLNFCCLCGFVEFLVNFSAFVQFSLSFLLSWLLVKFLGFTIQLNLSEISLKFILNQISQIPPCQLKYFLLVKVSDKYLSAGYFFYCFRVLEVAVPKKLWGCSWCLIVLVYFSLLHSESCYIWSVLFYC